MDFHPNFSSLITPYGALDLYYVWICSIYVTEDSFRHFQLNIMALIVLLMRNQTAQKLAGASTWIPR